MTKKVIMLAAVLALCAPVFAAEEQGKGAPQKDFHPAMHGQKGPHGMKGGLQKGMMFGNKEDLEKMKEAQAKHKADSEQLEKLVKEYKKAKDGSKKQTAAREEIAKKLGEMREEQIQNRREKIAGFEKRIDEMKGRLAEEEKPEAKEAWLNNMTEQVIKNDGKFNPAFRVGPKGHGREGFGGPREGGPQGPGFGGEVHPLPMPPAPAEEK